MTMSCYSRLLSSYPGAVVAAVAIVTISCLIIAFTAHTLPDFSDPQLGFECRGTVLSQRSTAWENLLRTTRRNGPLTTNPLESTIHSKPISTPNKVKNGIRGHKLNKTRHNRPQRTSSTTAVSTSSTRSPWGELRTQTNSLEEESENNRSKASLQAKSLKLDQNKWRAFHPLEVLRGWESQDILSTNHSHFEWGESITWAPTRQTQHRAKWGELQQLGTMGFLRTEQQQQQQQRAVFCDQPHPDYAHVIVALRNNASLWKMEAIHSTCRLDHMLRSSPIFPTVCQTSHSTNQCCSSWTIGHYIALLRNRTSCFDVDQLDIDSVLNLLETCAKHYHGLQLSADCDTSFREGLNHDDGDDLCGDVPRMCTRHNAVYHILHYLTDNQFLVDGNQQLRYASIFLPVARSTALLSYYHSLEPTHIYLQDNITEIVGADFGLKEALFNEHILKDILYLSIGAAVVCGFIWWYTSSLFLTVMTLAAVGLSLALAYFVYTFVFELQFFPFMNLLAAVIVVGIGADDAFVYVQVWRCTKMDKDGSTLPKLVADSLTHAGLSMFVTSFTTAAAFFSSLLCPVTAVRCFSLFAGVTVVIHFLMMLSWLPASVLLAEKYCSTALCSFIPCSPLQNCCRFFSDIARVTFDKIIPCVVVKLRYVWIVFFGLLAISAGIVVFYYPKLQLPDTKEFQLFASDHLFERYDLKLKNEFWFEKSQHLESFSKLPLRFVWGVLPEDNGNYLDPTAKGVTVWDTSFNMAAPESQKWLFQFCQNLREQSFCQPSMGPLLPNCFIETFVSWMERKCEDSVVHKNRTPCCETSKFPYSEEVFNQCIVLAMKDLYETPAKFFLPGVAGPRFSKATHKIQAIVIEYDSAVSYSLSYTEMHRFYQQVESWLQSELATAPPTMKKGWFTSDLTFYDVQEALSGSTTSAIGLSMVIGFVVLLIATCNVWLSFISVTCLSSVVLVSVAALVLLGWKLNILESVSITVAVGLSVDFTLHYAVGYRLSPEGDRESSVVFSLSRMSSPILMAALTTFAAGAAVLPSSVVAYKQIGTFVVIVMVTSFLYSTLFLPSLLCVLGPQQGCGQIRHPNCTYWCHCCHGNVTHVDKTVYSYGLSESTLSTSSATCPNPNSNIAVINNETHELEPLTAAGRVTPKTRNRPRSGSLAASNLITTPALSSSSSSSAAATATGAVGTGSGRKTQLRKISLPSAALLADDRPEIIGIEPDHSDMWMA